MIEINLIPDVKLEYIKARKARSKVVTIAVIAGIISLVVVVLLVIYAYGVQTVRNVVADNTIKSENAKLEQVKDLPEMLTIQNQLATLPELNSSKSIYSRLFDVINTTIPTTIQMSQFAIDSETQTITFDGQSAIGYSALETFKKMLSSAELQYKDKNGDQQKVALASNINVGETSYGENSEGIKVLRFTFSFEYAEELFAQTSKNVTISVASADNVTDSYLGIPKSIFTNAATDLKETN